MSHKWHYYNSEDTLCKYTSSCGRFKWNTVYCGRSINFIHRHTEFKSRVTCYACLKRINSLKEDNDGLE